MHYYTYDGTFEGLLSVIFEAYERKAFPDKIAKQGQEQPGIFATNTFVATAEEKATRVWQGLKKKLSESACNDLYKTYLWEQPGFEMLIFKYVELVFASRRPGDYDLAEFANYIQFGVSPRASIALNLAAKAVAFFDERDYVLPEDIKEVAADVMNHRIILNYEAEADGVKTKDFVEAILRKVPIS